MILAFIISLALLVLIQVSGQNNPNITYVHLIPHSHDDYGWLYTIDGYYSENVMQFGTQYGNVRDIMNSVYKEIQKNSDRKYIQVEVGFLNMWWENQSEEVRKKYKELVKNGQIEIINGGWTMHDEATPYFEDMIDQMAVGHQWVKDKLDVVPTIGWQIDPFGHQSTNAAIFSQMGFNAQWFARIDYQDFDLRKQQKALEMIWQPSQTDEDTFIFSAVNYQHYSPPRGFFFERGDIVTKSNVQQKANEFVNYFKNMKQHFQTNHVMHTMGEDFTYHKSQMWFDSIDLLREYINSRQDQFGMVIQYSTPSQYLEEVNKQEKVWPVNSHDFFPYADARNAYWTGYFTSRPALKGLTKDSGRYLQAIRNIFSFESIKRRSKQFESNYESYNDSLQFFEQQVAALMHHDGVSGTEKQHVVDDYILRLSKGFTKVRNILHPLLQEYAEEDINESQVQYTECNWNTTSTHCSLPYQQITGNKPVLFTIYNPSISRQLNMRIRIPSAKITLINQANKVIKCDIICSNPSSKDDCDLYFKDFFEGYSYQYYKIIPQESNYTLYVSPLQQNPSLSQIKLELTGQSLLTINLMNNTFVYNIWEEYTESYFKTFRLNTYQFSLDYQYYVSYNRGGQASGAYIFRPEEQTSHPYSVIQKMEVYKGSIVSVIVLEGTKTTTQMRIYHSNSMQKVIELETFVHSIDVRDYKGKEIVMHVNTNVENNKTFFTDSNGLEMQKRVLNFRPTWNLQVNEEVSGNYYPVCAMIRIQDQLRDLQVTLINDRSQGGTSLKEGQLELMIHRRILADDNRGVGEHLNESDDINRGEGLQQKVRHFIVFEKKNDQLSRRIQNELDAPPLVFYSKTDRVVFDTRVKLKEDNTQSIIKNENPFLRVYFRTFGKYYTLRLYNINEVDQAEFSLPENLRIEDELTLTANQSKQDWVKNQLKWKGSNGKTFSQQDQAQNLQKEIESSKVVIKPLQLRVFKVVEANQK